MSSAPVFLVDPSRLSGEVGDVVIDGAEGRHAATVRRLSVGERVDVTDGRGRVAESVVTSVGRDELVCRVHSVRTVRPSQPRLIVVQALAKGDRGERAVVAMTEVGVDEIVPWPAARSITQWKGERGAKALGKWRSAAREAAKQARRAWLPELVEPVSTAGLAKRLASATLGLVLHESAERPLSHVEIPADGEVVLVVGPEGGITDDELDALTTAGAVAVHMGPSVMRTSTAGTVAAGVVLSRTTRWTH